MTSKVRPERQGYDKIIYQQHVDRIKKMAPTVDSGPPHEKPFSNKWELDKVKRNFFQKDFDLFSYNFYFYFSEERISCN